MKNFNSINEILDFAINAEQEAVDFYNQLAVNSKTSDMQQVFTQFAQEEIGHKARLIKIKNEGSYQLKQEQVADLKIADYLVSIMPTPGISYQDALVLAMKKEKAAFKLYFELSKRAQDTEMKNVFLSLAQEESKHKLRFEIEYDEFVLREN
ncbi:MAG: rubrerythrin [Bacteroidetes bacterium GWC2_33_15]|nr:MAG: rubrerythrin [Bacteroidetes bacterium GWA2_33_15]OFX52155.1 MAG: rubrerythrin [Bacteroidetes bacterium GWC2_33_15]OFX64309.1 MAG: rubrerythrin [Bacteroidetes bacterium GWB2_32_14]OFX67714.1 MAG: rubrerythrin [Bacteroidetes bacterium GWD2_33_33]HAN19324.1 rubrerythrin [Bacteroidales bacterium]